MSRRIVLAEVRLPGYPPQHDCLWTTRLARTGPARGPARRRGASRACGIHRRHVFGPLLALERPPGRVGIRLVLARRRASGHRPDAVRRGERAGAALPPRDHRPGDRQPRVHVPGQVLDRTRQRRGFQRAHHRSPLATQGPTQRTPAGMRRHHPRTAGRRRSQPRRTGDRGPGPAVDAAAQCAAAHRSRVQHRNRRLVRPVGGRPHHGQRPAGTAARDRRRLPRRRRARAPAPPGAPELGARRGSGPGAGV